MNLLKQVLVADIFCGVGGLTHGFIQEGFNVSVGIDCDSTCRYPYEHNNHAVFINKDVMDLKASTIKQYIKNAPIKILIGCAPCQPFSTYNNGNRKKDNKWKLLYRFSELIKEVQPNIFSMENVPALKLFDNGKVLYDFKTDLESIGYHITEFIVNCPDYGIPQQRKRLVVFGSKYGPIEIEKTTYDAKHYKTVKDAIGSLPPIAAGEISVSDPLHRSAKLSKLNLLRIQNSTQGGTWHSWDKMLVAKCHKRETGHTFGSVYGRMSWDKPAPTMTTLCFGYGNGRFGHPEQDRAISLREAALFQTFPKDYQFVEPGGKYSTKIIGRQIGNAVPVVLGNVIARSIKAHLISCLK